MLAALPHLTSIKLDPDFVGTIGLRQNHLANDASFRGERDCELLLAWPIWKPSCPLLRERNPVLRAISIVGRLVLACWRCDVSRECISELPASPAVFSLSPRGNVNSKWPPSSVIVAKRVSGESTSARAIGSCGAL